MALLGATLLPAAYLWVQIGRSIPSWLDYPSLSLHDPVQRLYLYGEHQRLSSADQPASEVQKAKQQWADALEEFGAEMASYRRIAPRHAAAREERATRDMEAFAVVAAGWGDAAARERLEQGSADDVPEYAQERRNEIMTGSTERDHERAARVRRHDRARRSGDWLELGLAVPATFFLYLTRKRRSTVELGPVPVDVVWGLGLWLWAEAAVKLMGAVTGRDVPVLAGLHTFSRLMAIPFVLALVRGAWGRGPETPLECMRRWPTTRDGRLNAALWTGLGLALSTAATLGVNRAAKTLGFHKVWSQALLEKLLVGTHWEAAGTALSLVAGAPFLEEILYRGLFFGGLSGTLGVRWAAIASSLMFAAMHGYGFVSSLIVALHGCIYALVYVRTRSLWPGMLVHAAVNVGALLYNCSLLP